MFVDYAFNFIHICQVEWQGKTLLSLLFDYPFGFVGVFLFLGEVNDGDICSFSSVQDGHASTDTGLVRVRIYSPPVIMAFLPFNLSLPLYSSRPFGPSSLVDSDFGCISCSLSLVHYLIETLRPRQCLFLLHNVLSQPHFDLRKPSL